MADLSQHGPLDVCKCCYRIIKQRNGCLKWFRHLVDPVEHFECAGYPVMLTLAAMRELTLLFFTICYLIVFVMYYVMLFSSTVDGTE